MNLDGLLSELKKNLPKFLKPFQVESMTNSEVPTKWNRGESFITKGVGCRCGSYDTKLLSFQSKELRGLFRKREVTTHLAPLYIQCVQCNERTLLLNPEIHGWSGELGESACLVGLGDLGELSEVPGRVIVNYSFQGIENYEDLIEEGGSHIENHFDTVTVYFRQGNEINEVVSYECS